MQLLPEIGVYTLPITEGVQRLESADAKQIHLPVQDTELLDGRFWFVQWPMQG